ncbi:putative drug exporter of the RND superfamily [Streptomyces zhaozhouensis]|uniref:Putative drug exporter of the RND superfamily n=1 Tax=Streptomyces zhaozhouensis TaxID=1300267 RepID=A0A286E0M4_9ACTN|nr:MMPL family transporter [Streptomyces zhaozhouensis]SOD64451.1 putative drug exporter of the RND superfamily [Streptomyces zhaozhouensis]
MGRSDVRPSRSSPLAWGVLGLWLLVVALALPLAGQLGESTEDEGVEYLPASAESTEVARLTELLPGGDTTDLLLVAQRDGGLTAEDRALVEGRLGRVDALFGLAAGDPRDAGVVSDDGGTALHPFSLGELGEEERTEAVDGIRELIGDPPGGLTLALGGSGALGVDAEAVFESIDVTLMLATAGIVALLLVLTYRSPLLWLVPLLAVGVAAVAAMALVNGLVSWFDLTVTTMSSSIMTVLIFGAGTDYALLLVARYREELRRLPGAGEAMAAALRGCGPALLASSGTVSLGLLCLTAADLNSSSGLGPVGAVGVLCALAVMVTLLPALLVLLGRRVFWPLVPRHGESRATGRDTFFARLGSSISRRPATVLVGGTLLLGALSLGALRLPGPLAEQDNFTETPASVRAMELVADAFPERSGQPITVLADADHAEAAREAALATDGVAEAEPGREGGGWREIQVFATAPPESDGEQRTVDALRERLAGLPEARALVGGPTAQTMDLADTASRDQLLVIPLVLAVVLLVLAVLLRALVAPLLLLAAVVASWGAAMGLGGLVFGPVLGFEGLDAQVPLLSFVFCVALGVDYGIFLMHRMREEALNGADTRTAALDALRTTGGVIASAGVVLAATFCVLAGMPMVVMAEMGFVVAVGVLLDTFLVRTYLVTSASWLLDRRVWWPGPLGRRPVAPGRRAAGDAVPVGSVPRGDAG